jgi:hypothetical protein
MINNNKLSSNTSIIPDKEANDYEIPIGDNFKLNARKKLGSGAFGDIYFGTNTKLGEDVAIKLEPTKAKHPQLFYESKLYMALQGGGKHCIYEISKKIKIIKNN